jgi:O-antigen/teichoic acid export membrane protein
VLGYRIRLDVSVAVLRRTFRYVVSSHMATVLSLLPSLALPMVVLNLLGPVNAALYYVDMSVAAVLFVIPFACSQSMFAEASYREEELVKHVRKATAMTALLMIPAAGAGILIASRLLGMYGERYATGGAALLRILFMSAFFVGANCMLGAMVKVTKKTSALVASTLVTCLVVVGLSIPMSAGGLAGIGWAWMVGQAAGTVVLLVCAIASGSRLGLRGASR